MFKENLKHGELKSYKLHLIYFTNFIFKNKTMTVFGILAVVVFLLALFSIKIYNELTRGRILVQEGWSGIGTFLQQRNDVIPNMVEIVKGYAGHENKTLTDVIKWRNQSASAKSPEEQNTANAGLQQAMLNFNALAEAYPDLKANTNFLQLQEDLGSIEEKINQSRRYYNGTVREYNTDLAVFPKNIVAGLFGFSPETFFKEDEAAATAPKISFQ